MKYLILTLAVLFICSCNQNKHENAEFAKTLEIRFQDHPVKASEVIKDTKVIKLETGDECLIQRISKVQYIQNKLYILDTDHNSLLIFNKDGSFYKSLFKVGSGPGEYAQIMDFFVQGTFLYIMDYTQKSILKYDANLEYITKYKYERYGSQFVIKDDVIYIYNEPSSSVKNDFYFSSVDLKSGKIEDLIPRNFRTRKFNWSDPNAFVLYKNRIYLSPKYLRTIYCMEKNMSAPVYSIRFEKNNFPEDENINDYDITSPEFIYTIKENFYISDKYVVFDYYYNSKRNYCFYESNSKKIVSGPIENDLIRDFRFFPRWGNDNYLIEELAPYHVIDYFPSLADYNEQLKDIKADDNPVIILYTLKSG